MVAKPENSWKRRKQGKRRRIRGKNRKRGRIRGKQKNTTKTGRIRKNTEKHEKTGKIRGTHTKTRENRTNRGKTQKNMWKQRENRKTGKTEKHGKTGRIKEKHRKTWENRGNQGKTYKNKEKQGKSRKTEKDGIVAMKIFVFHQLSQASSFFITLTSITSSLKIRVSFTKSVSSFNTRNQLSMSWMAMVWVRCSFSPNLPQKLEIQRGKQSNVFLIVILSPHFYSIITCSAYVSTAVFLLGFWLRCQTWCLLLLGNCSHTRLFSLLYHNDLANCSPLSCTLTRCWHKE